MTNGDDNAIWLELRQINEKIGGIRTDVALIKQSQEALPCESRETRLVAVETWQHDMDVKGRPPSRAATLLVQLAVQLAVAGALLLAAIRILKGV